MKASACLTEDERNVSLFHPNGNRFCRGETTLGCAASRFVRTRFYVDNAISIGSIKNSKREILSCEL